MRVNEFFVNEGIFDDLRALGKMRQQDMAKTAKQGAGTVFRDLKSALTPDWYKNMANRIAQSRYDAELEQPAKEWVQNWDQVVDRLAAAKPKGQIISLAEYRRALTKWLEQQTKMTPNQHELAARITEPDSEMVQKYLADYFIPTFMAKEQVEAEKEFARSYGIDVDDPADLEAAAKQADAGQKPTGTDGQQQSDQSASTDQEITPETADREFDYTGSDDSVTKIYVKGNKYYVLDEDNNKLEELTNEEDLDAVKKQDPTLNADDEEDESDAEEEFTPDDSFTYVGSDNEPVEVEVKDGDFYITDEETGEPEKLTHPEDIEAVKKQYEEQTSGDGEKLDQEKLAAANKEAAQDKGTDNNVKNSKQDFHVVSFTPNLIIRYKNQEFLMNDENYPEREWFKLPTGTPVKSVMLPMLNKMADEAYAEQDEASGGGKNASDIDAGPTANAGVRVEPGTKLRVTDPKINGVFYKDALGNWTTEEGRRLKKPETLKYLEKLVKDGAPTRTEKVLPPTPEEKKKGVEK